VKDTANCRSFSALARVGRLGPFGRVDLFLARRRSNLRLVQVRFLAASSHATLFFLLFPGFFFALAVLLSRMAIFGFFSPQISFDEIRYTSSTGGTFLHAGPRKFFSQPSASCTATYFPNGR